MRVIVTRPAAQAVAWVEQLRGLGVAAQALPLIDIEALADPAPLQAAWSSLGSAALVVFVSPNAVEHFFAERPPALAWPAATLAGATGPGTAAALRDAGVAERCIVEPPIDAPAFDSESLWSLLAARDWVGRRVLVVRGEGGRDWLAGLLRERGAEVDFVAAYRRRPPTIDVAGQRLIDDALAAPEAHLWLFSSSEAIGHLIGHLRALRPHADWSASAAAASHPRIVQTAREAGFGRVVLMPPTVAAAAELALSSPGRPPIGPSIQSAPL